MATTFPNARFGWCNLRKTDGTLRMDANVAATDTVVELSSPAAGTFAMRKYASESGGTVNPALSEDDTALLRSSYNPPNRMITVITDRYTSGGWRFAFVEVPDGWAPIGTAGTSQASLQSGGDVDYVDMTTANVGRTWEPIGNYLIPYGDGTSLAGINTAGQQVSGHLYFVGGGGGLRDLNLVKAPAGPVLDEAFDDITETWDDNGHNDARTIDLSEHFDNTATSFSVDSGDSAIVGAAVSGTNNSTLTLTPPDFGKTGTANVVVTAQNASADSTNATFSYTRQKQDLPTDTLDWLEGQSAHNFGNLRKYFDTSAATFGVYYNLGITGDASLATSADDTVHGTYESFGQTHSKARPSGGLTYDSVTSKNLTLRVTPGNAGRGVLTITPYFYTAPAQYRNRLGAAQTPVRVNYLTASNPVPVATGSIPTQTRDIGSGAYTIVADLNTYFTNLPGTDTLTFRAVSSSVGIATVGLAGDDNNILVATVGDTVGSTTITITATDSAQQSATQSFVINVIDPNPNQPPTYSPAIADQTLRVGQEVDIQLHNHFSDDEMAAISWAVSSSDDTKVLVKLLPTDYFSGTYVIGSGNKGIWQVDGNANVYDPASGVIVDIFKDNNDVGDISATEFGNLFTATAGGTRAAGQGVEIANFGYIAKLGDSTFTFAPIADGSLSDGTQVAAVLRARTEAASTRQKTMRLEGVSATGGTPATITVTATDPEGAARSATFRVTVSQATPITKRTDIPSQTVEINDTLNIPNVKQYFNLGDATDVTYTADVGGASGVLRATVSPVGADSANVQITGINPGQATITLKATNDADNADFTTNVFVVTVTGNPVPVTVGSYGDLALHTTDAVRNLGDVTAKFSDPGDTLTYAVAVDTEGVVIAYIDSSNDLHVGPTAAGTAVVTVTATDTESQTATQSFTVTVTTGNRAPIISSQLPTQNLTIGQAVSINFNPLFSDPDGDSLTYTYASSAPTVATLVADASRGGYATLSAVSTGITTITITVTDPDSLSVTMTVHVRVKAVNMPPTVVEQIGDRDLTVGTTVELDTLQVFTDPDNEPLTITAVSSAPNICTITVQGRTVTLNPVAVGGPVVMRVTATDTDGASVTDTFRVTCAGSAQQNRPPRLLTPFDDVTIPFGASLSVDMATHFLDPEGQPIAWSAQTDNGQVVSIQEITPTGIVVLHGYGEGTAVITLSATDAGQLSTQATMRATVDVPIAPPLITDQIENLMLHHNEEHYIRDIQARFTDPNGEQLSFAIHNSNPQVCTSQILDQPGGDEDVWLVSGTTDGTVTIVLTARAEGSQLAANMTFTVTVMSAVTPVHPPIVVDQITLLEFATAMRLADGQNLPAEPALTPVTIAYNTAVEAVDEVAVQAPQHVKNQAIVRIGGYLYDAPADVITPVRGIMLASGATSLLKPYIKRDAGVI